MSKSTNFIDDGMSTNPKTQVEAPVEAVIQEDVVPDTENVHKVSDGNDMGQEEHGRGNRNKTLT